MRQHLKSAPSAKSAVQKSLLEKQGFTGLYYGSGVTSDMSKGNAECSIIGLQAVIIRTANESAGKSGPTSERQESANELGPLKMCLSWGLLAAIVALHAMIFCWRKDGMRPEFWLVAAHDAQLLTATALIIGWVVLVPDGSGSAVLHHPYSSGSGFCQPIRRCSHEKWPLRRSAFTSVRRRAIVCSLAFLDDRS